MRKALGLTLGLSLCLGVAGSVCAQHSAPGSDAGTTVGTPLGAPAHPTGLPEPGDFKVPPAIDRGAGIPETGQSHGEPGSAAHGQEGGEQSAAASGEHSEGTGFPVPVTAPVTATTMALAVGSVFGLGVLGVRASRVLARPRRRR